MMATGNSANKGDTVLVVGSGGREHALAWCLAQSPRVAQLLVSPGNAGTSWPAAPGLAPAEQLPVAATDTKGLLALVRERRVDLVVVGPEAALAAGLTDALAVARVAVFGPSQAAARLEVSKAYAKEFMRDRGIPTAPFAVFDDAAVARAYVRAAGRPLVVKAGGLAAGKGVFVCENDGDAVAAVDQIMVERAFGAAGDQVVVEERLQGPEISILAFSDGRTLVPMIPARDHKRAYDGDQGPNTGGMGAYAPAPDVDAGLVAEVLRTVLQPAVEGMAGRGTPYVGVLYAGLMLTPGGPQVLEFNCRFGDPETQVVLPLLASDLYELLLGCVQGRLDEIEVAWLPLACATVVMAAPGYPGSYPRGIPLEGVEALAGREGIFVFHAGTARRNGRLVSAGGRVLDVTALGSDLDDALARAYEGVAAVGFENAHYRRDIGRPGS